MDLAHGLNDLFMKRWRCLGKKDRVGAKYLINTTFTRPKLMQRTLHGFYKRNNKDLRACSTKSGFGAQWSSGLREATLSR